MNGIKEVNPELLENPAVKWLNDSLEKCAIMLEEAGQKLMKIDKIVDRLEEHIGAWIDDPYIEEDIQKFADEIREHSK